MSRQLADKTSTRRNIKRITCAFVVLCLIGCLAGCRPTDTLTDIIYADWATEIDYDNPMKAVENAPDKAPTTALPKIYETTQKEDFENIPEIYEPEDKDEEQPESEEPEYDQNSTVTTQSAPKSEYKKDAPKHQENTAGGEQVQSDDADDVWEDAGTIEDTGGTSDAEAGDDFEPVQEPDPEPEEEEEAEADIGGTSTGSNPTKDLLSEPDRAGKVIAFGEMANIVALLAGSQALWAADDTYLNAASGLFSDGLSSTYGGFWPTYSTTTKTMKKAEFAALCAQIEAEESANRPCYLIYDGSVGCPLTDAQVHLDDLLLPEHLRELEERDELHAEDPEGLRREGPLSGVLGFS